MRGGEGWRYGFWRKRVAKNAGGKSRRDSCTFCVDGLQLCVRYRSPKVVWGQRKDVELKRVRRVVTAAQESPQA